VSLQSPEAEVLLDNVDPSVRMDSAHLVSAEGRVHSAGALVDPLLRLLDGGRPLAALAGALPRTTERVYRLVARNRHRLGRLLGTTTCAVDPEASRRR
jgi:predicted DCC family thiol-disulfide oxidoreductase YuxK